MTLTGYNYVLNDIIVLFVGKYTVINYTYYATLKILLNISIIN